MRVNNYAKEGHIIIARSKRVCAFVETYCKLPEGAQVVQPIIQSMKFQKQFIMGVYDRLLSTNRAYPSVAKKELNSALIASILLVHQPDQRPLKTDR